MEPVGAFLETCRLARKQTHGGLTEFAKSGHGFTRRDGTDDQVRYSSEGNRNHERGTTGVLPVDFCNVADDHLG